MGRGGTGGTAVTRAREVLAILLVGDGVVGALIPRRHVQRWESGPKAWQRLMRAFAVRPRVTRLIAVAEAVAGIWYAYRLPAPGRRDLL